MYSMDQLFHHADKNANGFLSLEEVLIMASPDINNNKIIEPSEKQKGLKTASVWIAYILDFDESSESPILADNKISLSELQKFKRAPVPELWIKGSYTADGDLTPTEKGAELLQKANELLSPYM